MIINNLYSVEVVSFHLKTNPELIINSNAILSRTISLKSFQMISWRHSQVLQVPCIVYHDQLSQSNSLYVLREFL